MASKQHPQHLMAGSSSRFGLSHDYPLATAASFSSPNKKWVLNEAKDVVEVVGDGFHHQHHAQQHHQNLNLPQFLEGNLQQQQGFMSECGRGGSLTRYNSAPSCLFSDLDQIARSLNVNEHNPQIFSGANPPLNQQQERGNPNHSVLENLKNKSTNNNSSSNGENSRFSAAQSSVVSLGMDFEDQQQEQQRQENKNGFTGLLTGSSTTENNNNNTALFSKAASNLARQSSSPASLLSRLEIDRGQTSLGSSEEDSPLLRSPMHNHSHNHSAEDHVMVASVSGAMDLSSSVVDCGFWDGSSVHPVLQQQHHHQQQNQNLGLSQPVAHAGVFNLGNNNGNGNSPSGSARKRMRDVEMELMDAGSLDHHQHNQQQQHTLTRHMSLPVSGRSGGGLLGGDNLLSQDSVPCRLRAKRGCATHPRSIAERVRRTKISERMRKLQELVPNMDKQTNTSDMLDEAVEYMKYLQKQVEDLRDCKEKCQGLCRMSQKNASSSNPAMNNPSSPL